MNKLRRFTRFERGYARAGLRALVGSPFRIKQIEDGEEGLKCKFCKSVSTPITSTNGNINCGECEAFLYRGETDTLG